MKVSQFSHLRLICRQSVDYTRDIPVTQHYITNQENLFIKEYKGLSLNVII